MPTLFPELADTMIPKERRGRKKHPNCPVCKTPRNLREQVIDEAIAMTDKKITEFRLFGEKDPKNDGIVMGLEMEKGFLMTLKALPVEEETRHHVA
jgi:hypothetical protein